MTAAQIDLDAVVSATDVDPKTAQRWLQGRVPHTRHRWRLVELLGQEETYLWPALATGARRGDASQAELVTLYPQRADVPTELWTHLLQRADSTIDVLAYAAVFLQEQRPDLNEILREKAAAGCLVRIAIGDPQGEQIRARGREERFGLGISSRCELALMHYQPLIGHAGITVRQHDTTLYNSIFRFDDEMLVNTHVYGRNAFAAPVLHLRRLAGGALFSSYQESFESIWEQSETTA